MMCHPSQTIASDLEISERTTLNFNFNTRKFMENHHTTINPIGEPNETVEIDERVITKGKYSRGRLIPLQWVVGAICRRIKKFSIVSVPDRREVTLLNVIKRHFMPGILIVTDAWRGYRSMESHPYHHLTVIHRRNFVNQLISKIHTQNIENL